MFLVQSVLDCVHFLGTIIFYIWGISLYLGRGTCLLLSNIFSGLHGIFKGFVIVGEELFRFLTELNNSIDAAATAANSGINGVLDTIGVSLQGFIQFFTSSESRTRLVATKLGLAIKNLCALIYGALILIADSVWWLLTLIPTTVIKLIVVVADFCIFTFDATSKAILYALQTILNDIFRLTVSLFVIFIVWKERHRVRLLLFGCYFKVKMFFRTGVQLVLTRLRNHFRQRSLYRRRPPMKRSPLSQLNRPALNETKLTYQQTCVICRDAPKSVLLWPCRHLCLCEECADLIEASPEVNTCPLCRGQVKSFISVYT